MCNIGEVIVDMETNDRDKYIKQMREEIPWFDFFLEIENRKTFKYTFILINGMSSINGGSVYVWEGASYSKDFDLKKFSRGHIPVDLTGINLVIPLRRKRE